MLARPGADAWADRSLGPHPAEHVAAAPGAFVLVRIVREVSRRYDLTYLDFGADWRRDFTVRAATKQLADFARDGLTSRPGRQTDPGARLAV